MPSSRFLALVSALLLAFASAPASAAQSPAPEAMRRFDVPAGDATQTLAAGLGAAVTGGGANKVPVISLGNSWIIGG